MPVLAPLRRRVDFLKVAGGRKWVTQGLILQSLPRPREAGATDPGPARVGFTASRKIGGAVIRNRARRRLRAAATTVLGRHAAPDVDYVVIARAETPSRPYATLLTDLETALRRLGHWRDGPEEEIE